MSKKFNYSYTTPTNQERKEIENIRNSYLENTNDQTILTIKKLDNKVKNTPTTIALILGITGTLIFGTGLTLVLETGRFILGSIISLLGCLPIAIAYPIYNLVHNKLKAKYKDQILELSESVLSNNDETNTKVSDKK